MKSGTGSTAAPVSLLPPVLGSSPPLVLPLVLPEVDASPLDASPLDASPLDASPLDTSPLDVSPLDVPLVVGTDTSVLEDDVPAPPLELPSPGGSIDPPLQP